MSTVIAVTGKGGSGKTVVSALCLRWLLDRGWTPVLAVDADPNLNLDAAVGVKVEATVGGIREAAAEDTDSIPIGMSKPEYFEYQIQQSLVEAEGFDLLAMGRPEGPGCYCYANNVLRQVVDRLAANYRMVVMDCEAGLEHLSRRTTRDVDLMIMVSDPTVRGVETTARVVELIAELKTEVRKRAVVINRARNGLAPAAEQVLEAAGLTVAARIPEDELVAQRDQNGEPL